MKFVDTHTHIYLEEFDSDRDAVIQRAVAAGVEKLLLPNIDSTSVESLLKLCETYPKHCFPMMGLHPTSVTTNYDEELAAVKFQLANRNFIAVGEIGMDLYWSQEFVEQQKEAFYQQLLLAKQHNLPVVIHSRNAHKETVEVIKRAGTDGLSGVFHCFGGDAEEAKEAVDLGFLIGIGGVVTFKNGGLTPVVEAVGISNILLETDAPYLAPVPYRGKRNESSYIPIIATKIADILSISTEEVAAVTTESAKRVFTL